MSDNADVELDRWHTDVDWLRQSPIFSATRSPRARPEPTDRDGPTETSTGHSAPPSTDVPVQDQTLETDADRRQSYRAPPEIVDEIVIDPDRSRAVR